MSLAPEPASKLLPVLDDLLSGWDPVAQVQLAFAAEAATQHVPFIPAPAPAPAPAPTQQAAQAARQQTPSPSPSSQPDSGSDVTPPPAFVHLDDLCHIRTTLSRAELENLQFDNAQLYERVVAGRVCVGCRQPLAFLRRLCPCRVCQRRVCPRCRAQTTIPPHMVPTARAAAFKDVLAGQAVWICVDCRADLGGVRR